jgi:hypothetical protein
MPAYRGSLRPCPACFSLARIITLFPGRSTSALGTLWQGFLDDCTDPSGDPVVLYDEIADRWIVTQFTTRGPEYFNCVAVSTTGDPLGSYFRYAFSTGLNFPDNPKYGVWRDGLYITTREFAPDNSESIGIYAVDLRQMVGGNPTPREVTFHLTSPAYLVGDGLLPADLDGSRQPPAGARSIWWARWTTAPSTARRSTRSMCSR